MKTFYYSIFFILLFSACAVVKPPQGGPKDEQSPQVIYQIPANRSTNFTGKQLILTFDEYINVQNWKSEISMSPYINPSDILPNVKGKKLIIDLPDNLRTNTTYRLDLGKSIVDLTERNPLLNHNILFSTGSELDSLQILGQVIGRSKLARNQSYLIGLYALDDSISPSKDKPLYFTKSTSDTFNISNLPSGLFQLFAFNDINSNFLYDSLSEQVAFLNRVSSLSEDTLSLNLFKEDFRKFQFSRPIYKNNFVELEFTKGLQNIDLDLPYLYNPLNRKLRIYSIPENNSFHISLLDSSNKKIDTTLLVQNSPGKFLDSLFSITRKTDYIEQQNYPGICISTPHLIESIQWDSILIIVNKDTVSYLDPKISHFFISFSNEFRLKATNPKDTLFVQFRKKALLAPSGHYNSLYSTSYTTKDVTSLGSIKGEIETLENHYILYLYNKSNQVISTIYNPKAFYFSNLTPDIYRIEVLIDTNNNKTFDTGILSLKQNPETIVIYPKPIVVKPNWDIGNINISF